MNIGVPAEFAMASTTVNNTKSNRNELLLPENIVVSVPFSSVQRCPRQGFINLNNFPDYSYRPTNTFCKPSNKSSAVAEMGDRLRGGGAGS